jgi:hypothetical protein
LKKSTIAFLSLLLGIGVMPSANAKSTIVGGPYTNLDPAGGVIHLNLTNYPKDKGLYIFQVVRNRASDNARPTVINMDNAVDVVTTANHADVVFTAVGKFGSTDCSVVECALWAQFDGASGSYQLTDEDQYLSSISFAAATAPANPADTIEASVNGAVLATNNPGTLVYRTPVTLTVKTGSGTAPTIKSSTADCSVTGNLIQALKGSGGCDFEVTSPGNTTISKKVSHYPFILVKGVQIVSQKSNSIKTGKTVALSAETNFGETISYTSLTKKICAVKGNQVTGLKVGNCNLALTAAGTSNYLALGTNLSVVVSKK